MFGIGHNGCRCRFSSVGQLNIFRMGAFAVGRAAGARKIAEAFLLYADAIIE